MTVRARVVAGSNSRRKIERAGTLAYGVIALLISILFVLHSNTPKMKMSFAQAPLAKVVPEVERVFKVNIQYGKHGNKIFTGTFYGTHTLEEVMIVVTTATGTAYVVDASNRKSIHIVSSKN